MTYDERYELGRQAFITLMTERQKVNYESALAIRERIESGKKRCAACGVEKFIESFRKDCAKLDGHRCECKECTSSMYAYRKSLCKQSVPVSQ